MRLLFIEDEPDSVESVIRWLTEHIDCTCQIAAFAEADATIDSFVPDIVILDLLESGSAGDPATTGMQTYDDIWRTRFCPIVVYSAQPDLLSANRAGHPFVKSVQKGRESSAQLEAVIAELTPHVNALYEAELHIRRQFALALRDVAPYAFEVFTTPNERSDAIVRSGRRRLAALMDDMSRHGQKLESWEQYLCPPIIDSLQLGDVLMKVGAPKDEPAAFRVILTPSCDLVASGPRKPKVENVLVARCKSIKDGFGLTSLGNISGKKLKDRLPSTVLSQGYFETVVPFPALVGRVPPMLANLRDLELIPFDKIRGSDPAFERVASIDSPFRELIAWAYMQIAGRPGVPDRDLDKWTAEIVEARGEDGVKEEVR